MTRFNRQAVAATIAMRGPPGSYGNSFERLIATRAREATISKRRRYGSRLPIGDAPCALLSRFQAHVSYGFRERRRRRFALFDSAHGSRERRVPSAVLKVLHPTWWIKRTVWLADFKTADRRRTQPPRAKPIWLGIGEDGHRVAGDGAGMVRALHGIASNTIVETTEATKRRR